MADPSLPPSPASSSGSGPITVRMGGGRVADFGRLPSGGFKLRLLAPKRSGTGLVEWASLTLGEAKVIEVLMALAEICRQVDRNGLPSGGYADAA